MTADQQRQFEHDWPALAARLNHLLARKRVSPWLIEDLVQETGLRLIRMWKDIDQARPLWPLTATIALNLLRDEMRKAGTSELAEAVPDSPSRENVEERGLARLELRAVGGALARMSNTQRQVILDEVTTRPSGVADPTALRMLRMRARQRLQNLMDQASVLGVTVAIQLRRLVREAEGFIGKVLPSHPEGAAVLLGLLAAVSIGVGVLPQSPSEARERGVGTEAGGSTSSLAVVAGSAPSNSPATRERDARLDQAVRRRLPAGARRRADRREGAAGTTTHSSGLVPHATEYSARITDDTYVNGELEAEVVGLDGKRDAGAVGSGPGSVNCTFTPGVSGASCTHGGGGWSERQVRVKHRGEARVAGERIL